MPHLVAPTNSSTKHTKKNSQNSSSSLQSSILEADSRPRFVPGQVSNGLPYFKFWPATREDMNTESALVAQIRRARDEDTERTFSGMRVSRKKERGKGSKKKACSRMTFMTDKKGVNLVSALLRGHGFCRTSSSKASIIWSFNRLKLSFHKTLEKGQKINQFPKSMEITRKSALSQNLSSMQQRFRGTHFDFVPKSFVLPKDAVSFQEYQAKYSGKPWIVKPAGGACGRNIFISNETQEILNAGMSGTYLVDQYIANPLLLDGIKFDLRIYVAVTSFYPLRVYVFEDGLVRFATQLYSNDPETYKQAFIHLTNYSLNKKSENFVANEDEEHEDVGTKQSISALMPKLKAMNIDCDELMGNIDDVIIKTLLCIEPKVKQQCDLSIRSSRSCFQLFGFDVLIDDTLKPWLLEVNFTPSLAVDAPIDMRIKGKLLADLFTLAGIQPRTGDSCGLAKESGKSSKKSSSGPARRKINRNAIQPLRDTERQMLRAALDGNLTFGERILAARTVNENARAGGFRCIYPTSDGYIYSQFMEKDRVLNFAITNFLFKQKVEATQDCTVDAGALSVMQARLIKQREALKSKRFQTSVSRPPGPCSYTRQITNTRKHIAVTRPNQNHHQIETSTVGKCASEEDCTRDAEGEDPQSHQIGQDYSLDEFNYTLYSDQDEESDHEAQCFNAQDHDEGINLDDSVIEEEEKATQEGPHNKYDEGDYSASVNLQGVDDVGSVTSEDETADCTAEYESTEEEQEESL